MAGMMLRFIVVPPVRSWFEGEPTPTGTARSPDMTGDHRLLADEALRPIEQGQHQQQADEDALHRAPLGLVVDRDQLGDQRAAPGPDAPDDEGAEERPLVVAAAADDQHRPDLEGDDRRVVDWADEADEARIERAGKAHDGGAEHERLEAEAEHAL